MPINHENVRSFGAVATDTLPTPAADGGLAQLRVDRYGALMPSVPLRHALGREGSYYSFFNATLDVATTEAGHAAPVLADVDSTLVKAAIFFRNISTSTTKGWHLDWLKLHVKVAGATGSSILYHAQVGTTTRLSTGGVALTVTQPNMGVANDASSLLTAQTGPIVITAENATTRNVMQGLLRDSIEVAGDTKTFIFGAEPLGTSNGELAAGTHDIIHMPPVFLPSGAEFILGLAQVAQNAAGVYGVSGGMYYR